MSAAIAVDRVSLLADVPASLTLAACEAQLHTQGLTLGLDAEADTSLTLGAWLARGAPGARDPWLDPADHLLAGLEAQLHDGRVLTVRPSPRRAVGPDLIALVVGAEERFAKVTRAWMRVHPRDVKRPAAPLMIARNPALNAGETALLAAIVGALRNP